MVRRVAGVLVVGMVWGITGCVERLVTGEPTDTEGSSSTALDDGVSGGDTGAPECTRPEDCPDGSTCFEGICVGDGELRISLSWSYVSDLDLHVETPTGVHISFENSDAGGGLLDVDDCVGGVCLDNSATHVENIFFPSQPPLGEYRVWVYNFDGLDGGPFEIVVSGATTADFTGTLANASEESQIFVFEI